MTTAHRGTGTAPRTGVSLCGAVQRMVAGPYDIRRFRLPPTYRLGTHAHDVSGFVLCLDGEYRAVLSGRTYSLRLGDVMVLASDVEHEEYVRGATECLIVTPLEAGGLLPDGLIRRMRGFSLDQHSVEYSNLYRLWVELLVADDLSAGEAADATGEIAGSWLGSSRMALAKPSRWLEGASNRLRGCYTEKNVVVKTAEELNISVEHLVRTFRLRFGITPGQFVRYCRMIDATRALVETDTPIAQVALDAGFADQSHLTRLFRLTFRTTPHRYRLARACDQ